MITLRPWLNRFVIAGKIYARTNLTVSMSIKRGLNRDAEETTIKPEFSPTDTLYDVYRKINDAITHEVMDSTVENDTDMVARILNRCPAWLIRVIVNLVNVLDHWGLMPKAPEPLEPFSYEHLYYRRRIFGDRPGLSSYIRFRHHFGFHGYWKKGDRANPRIRRLARG